MDVIEWLRYLIDAGYGWNLFGVSLIVIGLVFGYLFDICDPYSERPGGDDLGDWGIGGGGGD